MAIKTKVTVAQGDGIGPEIMEAVLRILDAAGAGIEPEFIEIGERVYAQGLTAGIASSSWETLRKNKVFLKAPITTPQGKGYKSLNVTVRKSLGLFANVRPNRAYHPIVKSLFPDLDVVIVRENEEDLYAAIEHQQTGEVVQCLKLITRPGCEKIVRYAFEFARANGRKKVTCMTKDNIMKQTDGMFHDVFNEVRVEYPEIESDHMIIDIGTARLATRPEDFDVVVTLNLYGDIVSDVVAEAAGSVGMAGSANIGEQCAMFEAIHGSAPDIAGQDIANPSGLLNAAVMMLQHIGRGKVAEKIANAWLATLEDGIHTADMFTAGKSREKVGTQAFADAVIARLGQEPGYFQPISLAESGIKPIEVQPYERKPVDKQLVGADIFLDWWEGTPNELGRLLTQLAGPELKLKMITNRGVKVYPNGQPETFCTDHWRCRFVAVRSEILGEEKRYEPVDYSEVLRLQNRLYQSTLDIIKTENLYYLNGQRGFSLGQGE
ncbi:MAG: NADP-dependent isocitrate dehydrogenase [Bacteroidota bacterium]